MDPIAIQLAPVLPFPPKIFAIVRLYQNAKSNENWEYTDVWGALFLGVENDVPTLILYDVTTQDKLWEFELYAGAKFEKLTKHFCALEGDNCIWGISFSDKYDANTYAQKVDEIVNAKKQTPGKSSKKSKKTLFGSFFGSIKSSLGGDPNESKKQNIQISRAKNFTRSMHIGYDPEKGFVYENFPPEWKELFTQAGIRKDDLKDEETAKAVFKVLKKAERKQDPRSRLAPRKNGPPPPRNAPPPVPGKSGASGRSAPPPPPGKNAAGGRAAPPPPPGSGPPPPPPLDSNKLSAITKGAAPPPQEGRDALLAQIRAGAQLRKVEKEEKTINLDLTNMSKEGKDDLMSMLQKTLARRAKDIQSSGSDSSDWSDDGDDW